MHLDKRSQLFSLSLSLSPWLSLYLEMVSTISLQGNGISDTTKTTPIFTYGTLKRGFPNHTLMQDLFRANDAVYHGVYLTVQQFPLVCGPYGVPFLLNIPASGHRIRGEVYSVTDRGLARLDELEGTALGHYERLPIQVRPEWATDGVEGEATKAEVYYAHGSFAEEMWRRKGGEGFSEYTEREARDYVKRGDRAKHRSFIEEIRFFVSSHDH